jgi:hypothetical protein
MPTIDPVARPSRTVLSGGSWLTDSSAIHGASGTASGSVSGATEDWCRTTQTLQFNYVRTPLATQPAVLDKIGLTQLSAVDNITQTGMYNVATLHNKQEKIHLPVGTSGYTQFQKFALFPVSADNYGITYGEVSGYIMGPQGSLVTTQPYIKTEKWDDTIHTVHDFTQVGTDHALISSGMGKFLDGTNLGDPYQWYVDYRSFWRKLSGSWSEYRKFFATFGWSSEYRYRMQGAYLTTGEVAFDNEAAGRIKLIGYIESLCDGFTSSDWYSRFVIPLPLADPGGSGMISQSDKVARNDYYDVGRHDYT